MIDALFGSKTRVKLLYLFMNNPERTFYVREITRKIDEQINSVRRELSNMLNIGIIKSDSKDNKIFYGVNKSYTFYAPLRKIFTSKELSAEKEDESAVWAKRFFAVGDVKLVVFAGKLVSGFDSDVDLLVVGNISKVKLRNLVKTIEEEQNIVISFAVMTYDDFYYRKSVQDKFITDIFDAKHLVVVDVNDVLNQEQQ
ncbi:MAG: transcriptional regulator [Candidatus Nomurabacteria bacterium]|nr:transcriptional regulator [Candidatus Nomurabacteria bacterium]